MAVRSKEDPVCGILCATQVSTRWWREQLHDLSVSWAVRLCPLRHPPHPCPSTRQEHNVLAGMVIKIVTASSHAVGAWPEVPPLEGKLIGGDGGSTEVCAPLVLNRVWDASEECKQISRGNIQAAEKNKLLLITCKHFPSTMCGLTDCKPCKPFLLLY